MSDGPPQARFELADTQCGVLFVKRENNKVASRYNLALLHTLQNHFKIPSIEIFKIGDEAKVQTKGHKFQGNGSDDFSLWNLASLPVTLASSLIVRLSSRLENCTMATFSLYGTYCHPRS